jgi:hypothetical protein
MKNLLKKLDACEDARIWAADKSWQEVYDTCDRGDWLLWLFRNTNPDDLQLLTLAKGHCANTVRHLLEDERSIKAIDAAIAFGLGEINKDELDAAADAAAAAAADAAAAAAADAAYAAAVATYAAAVATYAAAYAAAAAYVAAAAAADAAYAAAVAAADAADAAAVAAADAAAKKENQQQTADIVRKYISIEKFNITAL